MDPNHAMARQLAFGNRCAMEAQFTDDERIALAAHCRAAGVPLERWNRCKGIARVWEVLAVTRLATELRNSDHLSTARAFYEAAERLGLPADTIESRLKDWPRNAYAA